MRTKRKCKPWIQTHLIGKVKSQLINSVGEQNAARIGREAKTAAMSAKKLAPSKPLSLKISATAVAESLKMIHGRNRIEKKTLKYSITITDNSVEVVELK